ncbi:hypothetical protein LXL04_033775 [Taraxacum kok-saghyz]
MKFSRSFKSELQLACTTDEETADFSFDFASIQARSPALLQPVDLFLLDASILFSASCLLPSISQGFDEYMNLVLDEAEEVSIKKKTRKPLGRILLKGDNITLMMNFLFQQSADVKKQTVFFLQTADVWSTSSAAETCRCGPQTADVLASKKQTPP